MSNRPNAASHWRAAAVMLRFAWSADPRQVLLAFGLFALEALALTLDRPVSKPYQLEPGHDWRLDPVV